MKKNITFKDILIPENFLELQNQYKSTDNKNLGNRDFFQEAQIEDFSVSYFNFNFENVTSKEVEVFFYKDYLKPQLIEIHEVFMQSFQNEMDRLNLNKGDVDLFCSQKINDLLSFEKILLNCSYLSNDIKNLIASNIIFCLDQIQEFNFNKEVLTGDKMSFNLIRQDVLVLFFLLREKKHIKWHSNSELKVLLENNFMSYDVKTEKHINFKVGKNNFSDFKSGSRTINQSVERLRNIFQEKNFFDIT
ncbi:hypothetical protein [Polaribacter sp. IC073]|uniref:hypothetical protein n=1 Tax=Polaribacter sp. IC073 TaxID=2508540 RepID=UPI0011BE502F|nr:hypothetical protein [Polaribacter sp. IC073]TXD46051.1 hypothetical protein ES045_15225 [Polaribacter sp. IC073]